MIRRVLIANRGEIAVRVVAACRALGIECVAVYSDGDRTGLWTRLADRAVCIGPAPSAQSYLNASALVAAAKGTGCDAIHPGYGFLSENASFAALCEAEEIVFVGPRSDAIAKMGNKIAARRFAHEAGVPTVPGSQGRLENVEAAREAGDANGYPLLLKAAAGGGGRGMRIVRSPGELAQQFSEAEAEARAAFGDGALYAERFLEGVRHIEVQIVGDGEGDAVHFGERDCTLQRRSQKLFEEAPAIALSPAVRERMSAAALHLARSIRYRGAGTIEFVYEPASERFFFLEMNTRIQVEHPVTEMVADFDLVGEQLRVARGDGLSLDQSEIAVNGHAVECRINAEDAERDFRPSPGTIVSCQLPTGDGIRVDTHAYEGYAIPPFYDSMIAKLVVHGPTRETALERARAALRRFRIEGPATTVPFHLRLLEDRCVIENRTDTKWVEREFLQRTIAK